MEVQPVPRRSRRAVVGRACAAIAVGLVIFLACAAWGVATANTDYAFGPHSAHYQATLDSTVVVDLGPLGTIRKPLKAPGGIIGIRVTVHEIPSDLAASDGSADLLSGDLSQYSAFFLNPQTTLTTVADRLMTDAAIRTTIAWAVVIALIWGVYVALGRMRRMQLSGLVVRHKAVFAGAMALVLVGSVAVIRLGPGQTDADTGRPITVLGGKFFSDVTVTGRIGGLVNAYGGAIRNAYQRNEDFYNAAKSAATDALSTPQMTEFRESSDLMPVVMVSDLHCNVGMYRVIGAAVKASGATLLLNGGDTTTSGTQVEELCVDSLASAVPKGTDIVVSDGNHDSAHTARQEKQDDMTVLSGKTVTKHGLTILGDADPRYTSVGAGTVKKGEVADIYQLGANLSKTACRGKPVDVLLVHDAIAAKPSLDAGCAALGLSGHVHARHDPVVQGQGVQYVASSTGRDVNSTTAIGPLSANAEITLLYFDRQTKRAVSYQILSITPQRTAVLSDFVTMPAAPLDSAPTGTATPTPTVPAPSSGSGASGAP